VHATIRRIRVQPGRASEVAALIQSEYLPIARGIAGFVGYTLVDVGDDEITSVGVFATADAAEEANAAARAWTKERLAPLVASPLEAKAGAVLVQEPGGAT
jgi:hypothetical protein